MVRAICGVQLRNIKRLKDLMLCLNEAIDIVGYGKQHSLVWACIEERGPEKGI